MTVTWSNFVNNTEPRDRHLGAFAEKCINNRTIRRGRSQSCIVSERCAFGKVSRMQSVFLSRMERLFGDDVKIRVWPYYNGYSTGAMAF